MLIAGETFTESYAAAPESVGKARNALTAFAREAGVDEEQLEAIRLAASEAVTNAVLHAYRDRERGTVQVSASYVENELWLLVADAGTGLQPNSESPGLGLGLALVAQLADEFQILTRGSGGTELRLRFKLARTRRRADRNLDSCAAAPDQPDRSGRRGSVSSAFSAA
jgi:serine/threonine-protein kinase RsbW/stage II sporulation protein AB (anti-sigma F factor)